MQWGASLLTLLFAQSQRRQWCDDCVRRDRRPVMTVYAICPASTMKQYVPVDLFSAVKSRYVDYRSNEISLIDLLKERIYYCNSSIIISHIEELR